MQQQRRVNSNGPTRLSLSLFLEVAVVYPGFGARPVKISSLRARSENLSHPRYTTARARAKERKREARRPDWRPGAAPGPRYHSDRPSALSVQKERDRERESYPPRLVCCIRARESLSRWCERKREGRF